MTKLTYFFCLFFAFSVAFAQPNATPKTPASTPSNDWKQQQIQLQKEIVQRATRYGDAQALKQAYYTLIAIDSTAGGYRDSLLNIYFGSQAYVSAILLGRELNKQNPKNQTSLAILAYSEQNMGLTIEAIDHFKQLYELGKNPVDLYQAAALEFKLQRFLECNISIEKIMQQPETEQAKIYIAYNERQGQNVALKAACLNIRGLIAANTGKKEEARTLFSQALKLEPEFELAKNNLTQLDAPEKPNTGGK